MLLSGIVSAAEHIDSEADAPSSNALRQQDRTYVQRMGWPRLYVSIFGCNDTSLMSEPMTHDLPFGSDWTKSSSISNPPEGLIDEPMHSDLPGCHDPRRSLVEERIKQSHGQAWFEFKQYSQRRSINKVFHPHPNPNPRWWTDGVPYHRSTPQR